MFSGSMTYKVLDQSRGGLSDQFQFNFKFEEAEQLLEELCSKDRIEFKVDSLQSNDEIDNLQLQIDNVSISATGKLAITFNKPIQDPYIISSNNETSANRSRLLNKIEEALDFRVIGDDSYDEGSDKSIANFTLESFTDNKTLALNLTFSDPGSISKYIVNPDTLRI